MTIPDLIAAAAIPTWVWSHLTRGADQHEHPFHLLAMATVSAEGRPSVRIMTNRGADRAAGRIWFYSRMDTPKAADLRACEAACLLGYDPGAGAQVRLSGLARLHQHGALADEHWRHVSEVAQWLYQLPADEGSRAVGIDPSLPIDREQLAKTVTARARAQFCVIEFCIETIDWHQANGVQQKRAVMRQAHDWRCTIVD